MKNFFTTKFSILMKKKFLDIIVLTIPSAHHYAIRFNEAFVCLF